MVEFRDISNLFEPFHWYFVQTLFAHVKYFKTSLISTLRSSRGLILPPVDVTTYWCYFSRIIVYNLVTIYGITTKFGIRMHPYQISWQSDNAFVFYIATFTPWVKVWKSLYKTQKHYDEKKKKKRRTQPTFEGSCLTWFSWMWGDDIGRHFQR